MAEKGVDEKSKDKNWFENHQIKSIIIYTLLIAGAIFSFSKFILIENTENYYKAQIETHKAQHDNQQSILSQYQAKIDYLEKENEILREANAKYIAWLQGNPDNILYVENQNKLLVDEINELKKSHEEIGYLPNVKYELYIKAKKNEVVKDPVTDFIICVVDININGYATANITFPINEQTENRETQKFENIRSGEVNSFNDSSGKSYEFYLSDIRWSENTYEIYITEK